jgi:homoserine kinase
MGLKLKLPATSANLGPGFDALGLAMRLYLEVEAEAAGEFSIVASGRDAELVGSLEGNLMVETYRELAPAGPALALRVANEIPLGMGCGSSAAALVAGVMLANHFAELRMSRDDVLAEAARREGHPDNVAACVLGGMTASAATAADVTAVSFGAGLAWKLLVVVPETSLATSEARALLPESYSRADAVANVQATALLVAAFALGRKDLLAAGTRDRLHQPYRSAACPLLGRLLGLVGAGGVLSATLSGAGPSVLLIVDEEAVVSEAVTAIRKVVEEPVEVLETGISGGVEMDVVGLTD